LDVASILGARRVAFSTSRYPLSPSLSSAIVTIGGGFFKLGETQRVSGKGTIDWNGRGERGQSTASIGTGEGKGDNRLRRLERTLETFGMGL
jgi:hypothetical protein